MVNYVNTVFVSNLASAPVLKTADVFAVTGGELKYNDSYKAENMNTASAAAGKFIIMNCDANVAQNKIYDVDGSNANAIQTIKVGLVTKKNNRVINPSTGKTEYLPIVKWSNEIKAADIKSYSVRSWENDSEDVVTIDFEKIDPFTLDTYAEGDKRIITRLTFKDMPHRYRKWTESYEYITEAADLGAPADPDKVAEYKTKIVNDIANMINKEWKRARIDAKVNGFKLVLTALPYDDDDSVDSLSWANKVRFNANMYWTDPAADGWESVNKHFPKGVVIEKTPGKQYPASAKLVRDRESWAMGYQGILNRGEGTWPIIKPDMETRLDGTYDAITLEFENMYRAADDIQRKTKQNIEIYAEDISKIKPILDAFVSGVQQDEIANPALAVNP